MGVRGLLKEARVFEKWQSTSIVRGAVLYVDAPNLAYTLLEMVEKYDLSQGTDYELYIDIINQFFEKLALSGPKSVHFFSDGYYPLSKVAVRTKRGMRHEVRKLRHVPKLSLCCRLMHEQLHRLIQEKKLSMPITYDITGAEAEEALMAEVAETADTRSVKIIVSSDSDVFLYDLPTLSNTWVVLCKNLVSALTSPYRHIHLIPYWSTHQNLMQSSRLKLNLLPLRRRASMVSIVPQSIKSYRVHEFINVLHEFGVARAAFSNFCNFSENDIKHQYELLGLDLRKAAYSQILTWYFTSINHPATSPVDGKMTVEESGKINDQFYSFDLVVDILPAPRSISAVRTLFPHIGSFDALVTFLATTATNGFPSEITHNTALYLKHALGPRPTEKHYAPIVSLQAEVIYSRLRLLATCIQILEDVLPGVTTPDFSKDAVWILAPQVLQFYLGRC